MGMHMPGAAPLPALAAITARADSHPNEYAGERMNVVGQSAEREAATNLAETDQPFAPAQCAGASRMIGAPNEASLCQEVPSVLFAAFEVPFGRCGFTSDR